MHSHVGKSLGSCTCSLMRLIVQAPSEAVSGQSGEDLSVLFLLALEDPYVSQRVILGTRRIPYILPRSWLETSAQEMRLTPGQVQNSFLSRARQPASHIPKVASGRKKGSSKKEKGSWQSPHPYPHNSAFRSIRNNCLQPLGTLHKAGGSIAN